jgi:hypothetical protein
MISATRHQEAARLDGLHPSQKAAYEKIPKDLQADIAKE